MLHVMPIDARHCPGSVMYLFRGEFGRFLCTGDFRWELTGEDAVEPHEVLLRALDGRRVDSVYLDNTYCHPSHDFPARLVAAEKVFDIILSHPNHDVITGIDSLGKENLLVYIAQKTGRRNSEPSGDRPVKFFPAWAATRVVEGGDVLDLLDLRLVREADVEELSKICRAACWCIQDEEARRPKMVQVVHVEVNMPPIPSVLRLFGE